VMALALGLKKEMVFFVARKAVAIEQENQQRRREGGPKNPHDWDYLHTSPRCSIG
jgi:hypothetical protein